MITLNKENGKIEIISPYNADFVRKVKTIGGKWNGANKSWVVADEVEEQLLDMLSDIYGYAPEDKKITVRYLADDFYDNRFYSNICFGDLVLVERKNRDWDVNFYNTIVLEGGFPSSGGSAKYPSARPYDNTILQSVIPISVYEKLTDEEKENITIIERKADREKLLKEKETLLARLAEIEKELNK